MWNPCWQAIAYKRGKNLAAAKKKMMERARVQSQLEKIQNSISMINMHRYMRVFVSREGHIWHTLLLIYTRVLENQHLFPATFSSKSSVFGFPAKNWKRSLFPAKLKSTDLVGLSGQKPNWLGSFRAKSDFWKLN
jgi:hypothetical protein